MTPLYQAPSVTNAKALSSTGAALWQHLTTSFGYLNKKVSYFSAMFGQTCTVDPNALMQCLLRAVTPIASFVRCP